MGIHPKGEKPDKKFIDHYSFLVFSSEKFVSQQILTFRVEGTIDIKVRYNFTQFK